LWKYAAAVAKADRVWTWSRSVPYATTADPYQSAKWRADNEMVLQSTDNPPCAA
jgi:hypothetical protein